MKKHILFILIAFAFIKNIKATISGPSSVCYNAQAVYYSTNNTSGVSSYAWWLGSNRYISYNSYYYFNFPTDISNTNAVIKVELFDSNGNKKGEETFSVIVGGPPAPPVLSINSYIPCGSTNQYTYTVNNVSGLQYTWSIPSFNYIGGNTSNTVTGTYSWPVNTGVPLTVKATKPAYTVSGQICPTSESSSSVTLKTSPNAPTFIVAPTAAYRGETKNYQISAVPDATSYTWTGSGYASPSITGTGTSVNAYFANKGTATICATASNACGSSSSICKDVTVTCNLPITPITVCPSSTWVNGYGPSSGWVNQNSTYRTLADVNGDGKSDVVGFTSYAGVAVSLSTGNSFGTSQIWINDFSWSDNSTQRRILVDMNNDLKVDIVGFGANSTYISLSTGTSFLPKTVAVNSFGSNAGWNDNYTPRFVADVNGDTYKDIVGISSAGVEVAINNGNNTFTPPVVKLNDFNASHGWTNINDYPRYLTDVTGDGLPDVVGFGTDNVYVSVNTGGAFAPAAVWVTNGFGKSAGFINNNEYPRFIADMNNDGKNDIIAFGESDVSVALGTGSGFLPSTRWATEYGKSQGNSSQENYPRLLGKINDDNLLDIISFGQTQVSIGINLGNSFDCTQNGTWGYVRGDGWESQSTYPRFLSDVDGDGHDEIVGFAYPSVAVTNCPRPTYNTFKANSVEVESVELSFASSPNPSNGEMQITYTLQEGGNVNLSIVDMMGNKVKDLKVGNRIAGTSNEQINLSELTTGTYTCILNVNGVSTNYKKIVIVK